MMIVLKEILIIKYRKLYSLHTEPTMDKCKKYYTYDLFITLNKKEIGWCVNNINNNFTKKILFIYRQETMS
jgi:hypothetical protein